MLCNLDHSMGDAAMIDTDNGVRLYVRKHRPITGMLTKEEHALFVELAKKSGAKSPTSFATQVLREKIETCIAEQHSPPCS